MGIIDKNIISLGLKNPCAKILGCKEYIKVANIALLEFLNTILEKKKNAMIPIK
tara:strand:+ start:1933 stop:2094 length:162 start_codon:yes stop_codon:yes gene_type:complete